MVLQIIWGVNLYQYTYFKMVHIYTLHTITWLWWFGWKNISNVKQVDTIMHQHFWYLLIIYKIFVWYLKFKMASPWSWTVRLDMRLFKLNVHSPVLQEYWLHSVPKQLSNTSQFECHRHSSRAPSWIYLGKFQSLLGQHFTRSTITGGISWEVNFLKAIHMVMDLCTPFKNEGLI